jgi:hypothetical protein
VIAHARTRNETTWWTWEPEGVSRRAKDAPAPCSAVQHLHRPVAEAEDRYVVVEKVVTIQRHFPRVVDHCGLTEVRPDIKEVYAATVRRRSCSVWVVGKPAYAAYGYTVAGIHCVLN